MHSLAPRSEGTHVHVPLHPCHAVTPASSQALQVEALHTGLLYPLPPQKPRPRRNPGALGCMAARLGGIALMHLTLAVS